MAQTSFLRQFGAIAKSRGVVDHWCYDSLGLGRLGSLRDEIIALIVAESAQKDLRK